MLRPTRVNVSKPPTLTKRLGALETDKAIAETNFANAAVPTKLRIHPNLPALYRRKVEHLQEALSNAATQLEAGEIIRSLIDRIELTPEGDTLAIKLYGDLAQIIAFSETAAGQQKGPISLPETTSDSIGGAGHRGWESE